MKAKILVHNPSEIYFLNRNSIEMSLISSSGGKTFGPDKRIKEAILHQEIENLREIHRQAFEAFDKIVIALKKMITYKTEHSGLERNEIEIKNTFLDNLGAIELSLLGLIEDLESDHQLYHSTSIFRDSEKRVESQNFRENMKSYEEFKDGLTQNIHRLEREIQKLESNGYHIYAPYLKPNNVLSSLKKSNLDKYIIAMSHLNHILKNMKEKMNGKRQQVKIEIAETKKLKSEEYLKILKNMYWKEQIKETMLIEEIEKSKRTFAKEAQKVKITEQAIKTTNLNIRQVKAQIKIYNEEESLTKQELNTYLQGLKEKADRSHIMTPHIYNPVKGRSKSCHTVFARGGKSKNLENEMKIEECSNILGADFLQESLYV